jgi:S-formylglutathione hydrolase FrmB
MTVYAVDLDKISVVDGWVPIVVYGLTALLVVLGLGWRSGIWRRQLMVAVPGALVLTGLTALLQTIFGFVSYEFPATFYIWIGLIFFCILAAIVGWPGEHAGGRVASLLAIPVSALLLGQVVNANYAYYPTFGAVTGKVAENQVDANDLAGQQEQVRTTGTLPPNGSVSEVPIPGTKSGFVARDAYVYLPPAYFADPRPQLPVIMLLHGAPGDPANWTQGAEADQTADAFAAANGGKAPIIVSPDISGSTEGDSECVDSARGNVETYLMTDVVEYMRANFDAATGPNSLALAGLSTGATCSLMLALRHPDQVVAVGDYSGDLRPELPPPGDALRDLFNGDQKAFDEHDPTKILPGKQFPNLGVWFESGVDDPVSPSAQNDLAKLTRAAGIQTCVGTMPGGHDFDVWKRSFQLTLPWLSGRLGLTPMPDPLPSECTGG